MIRVSSAYMVAITMTVCLSHQYTNLYSYFSSLNEIFENEDLNKEEKEREYEGRFKIGIKLHSETLMYVFYNI